MMVNSVRRDLNGLLSRARAEKCPQNYAFSLYQPNISAKFYTSRKKLSKINVFYIYL